MNDSPTTSAETPASTIDFGPVPTKVWQHLLAIITAFPLDATNGWTSELSRSQVLKKLFRPPGRRQPTLTASDLNSLLPLMKERGFAEETDGGLRFRCLSRGEAGAIVADFYQTIQRALGQPGGHRAITSNESADVHHLALLALKDAAVRAETMRVNGGATGKPLGRAKTPIIPGVVFYRPAEKMKPAPAGSSFHTPTRAREDAPTEGSL